MARFIAAMDHSGGSTGGVLDATDNPTQKQTR